MLTDVIVAPATPLGRSAISVVRISGRKAHEVASAVLRPFDKDQERVARLSAVVNPADGEKIDEAVYVAYSAPRSYTGEDMVEISTHGGTQIPGEVVAAVLSAGARQAMPGEYTRRALLNGKLDLLQAEAVGDLIDATTPAQRKVALGQLGGGLSKGVNALREQVLQLETLCCYEIDFPEEDGGPVHPERIDSALAELCESLVDLLRTADAGERLREGALCVIAGPPNVGKSTLFNTLLGSDRAIVTDTPGTTRDAIEAHATFGGFPFRLIDTAGLRDTPEQVELLGIEVSHRYLHEADIVLYCVEASEEDSPPMPGIIEDIAAQCLVVSTKADLLGLCPGGGAIPDPLLVSAKSGEGIRELQDRLVSTVYEKLDSTVGSEPIVTRERHRVALESALSELRAFGEARTAGVETVVAATHLRAAVTALEALVGAVTPDDVLDQVFTTFCVGK